MVETLMYRLSREPSLPSRR